MTERALVFGVGGDDLVGVLHEGSPGATRGVLVIVGGPQYRVGSHRQFLLLARRLAEAGVPVLRFDYRGMGDSSGACRGFEHVDDDIRGAIDTFVAHAPGVREVVLWGLCDAASAATMYAPRDPRVAGLILLNPWVRTEEGLARARIRHYYARRLLSRDFWAGLLRGRVSPLASARGLLGMLSRIGGRRAGTEDRSGGGGGDRPGRPFPARMAAGWRAFRGDVLLILSGNDLTAAEFRDHVRRSPEWQGLLDDPRVSVRELPEANHTFSRETWRDQVANWTLEWIRRADATDRKRA